MGTQYKIEIKGLDKLQNAARRAPQEVFNGLKQAIKTSVHIIRPIMHDNAPRGKTGMLRRNIRATSQGLKGKVGPDLNITPYALYVHEGTRPYVIRPKQKKALYWPGAKYPVKKVKHPGIKANPYVEKTFNEIKQPVEQIFQREIDKFIRNFHR